MFKQFPLWTIVAPFLVGMLTTAAPAQDPKATAAPPLREIFVPFDDLNVILENDNQRVFLSRKEYEELVAKAVSKPDVRAPHSTAVLAATYDGKMEDGRAAIAGKIQIEVLNDGLQAIPLDLANVGIRSALVDGKPASLGRNEHGQVVLFVEGVGKHELTLALTALLQTSAATQTLQLTLPTTAAAKLQLAVAGNVEVKAGASVISRAYDKTTNTTKFELLPPRGNLAVVMSLNNKTLQDQRVVVTNSVLVTEVTQGYERIHARVAHRVLHGAVDKFRFSVPAGFEVTRVDSPLLARWEMKEELIAGVKTNVLEAITREPATDSVVLEISATRSPPQLENWTLPRLVPLDVAGQVAVVGLLVEDRLQAEQIAPNGMLPLDAAVLTAAIPETVNKAEPGAPKRVRQVVTYYVPGADYSLSASITKPAAEMVVTSSALLVVSDQELRVSGQFILAPQAEDLFEVRLNCPAGWQVTSVMDSNGTTLPTERYDAEAGGSRYFVRLPGGVAAGQQRALRFLAISTPTGWLENWVDQKVAFPPFTLVGTTTESGAIGVAVEDDLTVRPEQLQGLTPLSDEERKPLVAAGQALALAYRFDTRPFAAPLVIERTAPSLSADIYDFFKLETDSLQSVYELHYKVRDARTRELVFSLPEETPKELTIAGIAPTVVKETTAQIVDGRRRWVVQLAERQRGDVGLTVRFTQRYAQPEPKGLELPLLRAEGVEHQSVLVGVEGSAELDIQPTAHPRDIDVGELYGATQYVVSSRLVGAYSYVGTTETVKVDVLRRAQYALPAALIERAELVTRVARNGTSQSVARYDLKTKATLLEIRLPEESTLWSVFLDGKPTKPQRQAVPKSADRLLLTLPAQTQASVRKLQIVYETPVPTFAASGEVQALAPSLWTQERNSVVGIPQANLVWTLVLPTGYQVRHAAGTVFTAEVAPHEVALVRTLKWFSELAQETLPAVRAPRQAARSFARSESAKSEVTATESESSFTDSAEFLDASRSMKEDRVQDMPEKSEEPAPTAAPPVVTPLPEAPKSEPSAEKMPAPQAPDTKAIPQDVAPPQPGVGLKPRLETHWAEQGLNSLQIDVANDTGGPSVTFHSLGEAPVLKAQVVNSARIDWAACGVGCLVALVGVGLTKRPLRQRVTFVVVAMLLATVPLLVTSLLDSLAPIFDACFHAALALVPYYLVAAVSLQVGHWLAIKARRLFAAPAASTTTAALLLVMFIGGIVASSASAQVPIEVKNLKELLPLFDPGGPVAIPKDAIIIPYNAEKQEGLKNAEKVLIPYDKYVELWNRANPEKKLTIIAPPVPYALAGASYQATLADADSLIVTGVLEIDLFSDKPIAIPLTLVGGVLTKATLDGQPARIQIVAAMTPQAAAPAIPEAVALLHVSGKGRKKLELTINMGLERRGGWRIATGRLPAAPASALTINIPADKTEVRLSGLPDKGVFESVKANDVLQTALGAEGALSLQWRPKIAEGMVDQSLTAQSAAVIDVREDALRMNWRVKLDFGRGTRETFKLSVPAGYLVEQVTGENIRGWQAKAENGRQTIDVTLLKAAVASETLLVQIARRGLIGQGELASFAAPDLRVESAALHQGEIAIRRSRRLDVRSITVAELSRADADAQAASIEQLADASDAAGIELAPFQAYRFVREGFQLVLSANKLAQKTSALVRMIVRAEERGDSLDALIEYQVQGEPLYRARIYVPSGLEIDRLLALDATGAETTIDWAVTNETVANQPRKLLTVYLPSGQQQRFTLQLLGRLGKRAKPTELPAPHLEVLDVERQEGEIVVAPDRDIDVEATKLTALERIPGMEVVAWLNDRQRPLAKLALRFRVKDYAALLTFTPRTPRITATALTNVKITPKEIQETLFFSFHVEDAGVRELAVLAPKSFEKARLPDALLQSGRVLQKIVEPAIGANGQPLTDIVRIRFVLPEYVDGRIDLGLTRDRLVTDQKQTVAIPDVAVGRLEQRLIVLENSSRDEVVTDASVGLEALNEGQQAWTDMRALLGADSKVTQAFLVSPTATAPQLTFQTQIRQRAQQSQASIGLAEHLLIVDEFGAYRGRVELKVNNETEQFLEIELPAGARLWTAVVAGEPVKPVEPTNAKSSAVRIPLIKTAQGEGDYAVVLKYGGRIAQVRDLNQVNFPLIKVVGPGNLSVEQSHVRLQLPRSYRWDWIEFGGTLKQVSQQATLVDEINNYYNKQILTCQNLLSSADDFTKVRVSNNLKRIEQDLQRFRAANSGIETTLSQENVKLLAEVQEEVAQQQQEMTFESDDNRGRLNYLWSKQKQARTKNNAAGLGSNFELPQTSAPTTPGKPQSFNPAWFAQNALGSGGKASGKPADTAPGGEVTSNSRVAVGKRSKSQGQGLNAGPDQNQTATKGLGQGQGEGQPTQLELSDFGRQSGLQPREPMGKDDSQRDMSKDNLKRYGERLAEQNKQQLFDLGDQSGSQNGQGGGGQPSPMLGGFNRVNRGVNVGGIQTAQGEFDMDQALPTGLTSLDIDLPVDASHYEEFLFTTLRGDLTITARPVSSALATRLTGLAWLAVVALLAWLLTRRGVTHAVAKLARWLPCAIFLIALGLVLLVFLPFVGLMLLFLGACQLAYWFTARGDTAAAV